MALPVSEEEQQRQDKVCEAFQKKFKELAQMRWPRITQTIIEDKTDLHHTTLSKMLSCQEELFQPASRNNLVKILKVFARYERISSPKEANEFLQIVWPGEELREEYDLDNEVLELLWKQQKNREDGLGKQQNTNPLTSGTERAQLLDLYLQHVVALTKPLPWGYLPADFTSALEIDDVYLLPRLSTKEYRHVNVTDERVERELLRQQNPDQEKEEKERRISFKKRAKPSYSSLYDVVQSGNNVTLLGYMGSGKSMAANYIALHLAKGEGQSVFGLTKPKIPIVLPLGRTPETSASDVITFAIEDAVTNVDCADALKDILREEWNSGNVLLILDALDEFRGKLEKISRAIVQLGNKALTKSTVLLTSRPSAYRSIQSVGLQAFTVEELQREETFDFVTKWTKAFLKITGEIDIDDKKAQKHAKSLTQDIGKYSHVQEIVSNQLLLTLLTIQSLRPGGIQVEKVTEAELLNSHITYLIDWEESKGSAAPKQYGEDLLRIVFSYIGFEAQSAGSGMFHGTGTYSRLLHALPESKYLKNLANPRVAAEALLKFWKNTGLIQIDEMQNIRFRHQAFQYFGAALALTYQSEERAAQILADLGAHPGWVDVRRLYIGLKAHSQSPLE